MSSPVSIVVLGDTGEAIALRALLESMAHEVRLIRAPTPASVAPALIRASEDDVVILSAHGGARGFHMGSFGKNVDTSLLDGEWLPAKAAFDGVRFRDDTVLISTACATRINGLVNAMYTAGGHLIAPDGYPDGKIVVPWIGACLLASGGGLAEAVVAANALVGPEDYFSYG